MTISQRLDKFMNFILIITSILILTKHIISTYTNYVLNFP